VPPKAKNASKDAGATRTEPHVYPLTTIRKRYFLVKGKIHEAGRLTVKDGIVLGAGKWALFLGEVGEDTRTRKLRLARWIEAVAGTETRLRWRVNFGGGWSVFTGKDISTIMKTKRLRVAWGVQ